MIIAASWASGRKGFAGAEAASAAAARRMPLRTNSSVIALTTAAALPRERTPGPDAGWNEGVKRRHSVSKTLIARA